MPEPRPEAHTEALLTVRGLGKDYSRAAGFFSRWAGHLTAVHSLDFELYPGEIYGLVGESGCGKTTTARMLVRLIEPSRGSVRFAGREVTALGGRDLQAYRRQVRYVFQDPARSLDPRLSVGDLLILGGLWNRVWPDRRAALARAAEVLTQVGLRPDDLERRPGDFSGGQRQRLAIARALMTKPRVLLCDEVVSALDVTIQGQILKLLLRLRDEEGLSLIFIAHDLSVVTYLCDRVGVMQDGRLVEEGPAQALAAAPQHPYTRQLFAAVPRLDS